MPLAAQPGTGLRCSGACTTTRPPERGRAIVPPGTRQWVRHELTRWTQGLTRSLVRSAYDRLADVLRALHDEEVAYDIDLFIEPTPENVARLRQALRRVWDDPEIDDIRVEDLAGQYAVVRYGTPDDFAIDLTARIGSAFAFRDLESELLSVAGVPARVATPRTLYRMKKDTVRPQDRADAAELRRRFALEDD